MKEIIEKVNKILLEQTGGCKTLIELHQLVYVGAAIVFELNKQKLQKTVENARWAQSKFVGNNN